MTAATVAASLAAIISDMNEFLKDRLSLTYSYKTDDPLVGESFGIVGLGSLQALGKQEEPYEDLDLPILIVAGFADYKAAVAGAANLMMLLKDAIANVRSNVNMRGVAYEFNQDGLTILPTIRAPIKKVDGQAPSLMIVEIAATPKLKCLINKTECGGIA